MMFGYRKSRSMQSHFVTLQIDYRAAFMRHLRADNQAHYACIKRTK